MDYETSMHAIYEGHARHWLSLLRKGIPHHEACVREMRIALGYANATIYQIGTTEEELAFCAERGRYAAQNMRWDDIYQIPQQLAA